VGALLAQFREAPATQFEVVHVRHDSVLPASPLNPHNNPDTNAFEPFAAPRAGEAIFAKSVNSAFIGTGLEAHLRDAGVRRLVVAGLTTNHCVSTTTRMAGNLGFDVLLAGDACATFDRVGPDGVKRSAEEVHQFALGDLHREFCTVVETKDVAGLLGLDGT
jgi:nicotinamidase-related amidase